MAPLDNNGATPSGLVVFASDDTFATSARALAAELGAPFAERFDPETHPVALRLDERGLTLTDGDMEMRGDLTRMIPRIKPGRLSGELLVKAAKVKGAGDTPLAIDATAGLGEDALLLAAAGFRVWLFERDPVIAALLEDALRRAGDEPALATIVGRMTLHKENSIEALPCLSEQPDVVLLDPMFPGRQKSAAVKKKFQLLHHLEQPCADEQELLDAALAAKPRKIVIKRPPKGPHLAGVKPAYDIAGKAVRYDVIAIAR